MRMKEREREREREKEKEKERERERERVERDVEYVFQLLFLSLKGMTGALAPFSNLVK